MPYQVLPKREEEHNSQDLEVIPVHCITSTLPADLQMIHEGHYGVKSLLSTREAVHNPISHNILCSSCKLPHITFSQELHHQGVAQPFTVQ